MVRVQGSSETLINELQLLLLLFAQISGLRTMVITGPNMGGKSSYIKQVSSCYGAYCDHVTVIMLKPCSCLHVETIFIGCSSVHHGSSWLICTSCFSNTGCVGCCLHQVITPADTDSLTQISAILIVWHMQISAILIVWHRYQRSW